MVSKQDHRNSPMNRTVNDDAEHASPEELMQGMSDEEAGKVPKSVGNTFKKHGELNSSFFLVKTTILKS